MNQKDISIKNLNKLLNKSHETAFIPHELSANESIASNEARQSYENSVKKINDKNLPPINFVNKLILAFEQNKHLSEQKAQDSEAGKVIIDIKLLKEDFGILFTFFKSFERAKELKVKVIEIIESIENCLSGLNYNYLWRQDYQAEVPKITIQMQFNKHLVNKIIEKPWEENYKYTFKLLYLSEFLKASEISLSFELNLGLIWNLLNHTVNNADENYLQFQNINDLSVSSLQNSIHKFAFNKDLHEKILKYITKNTPKSLVQAKNKKTMINNLSLSNPIILARNTLLTRLRVTDKLYLAEDTLDISEDLF